MEFQRLTPDEFMAVLKHCVWTGRTLAVRWDDAGRVLPNLDS